MLKYQKIKLILFGINYLYKNKYQIKMSKEEILNDEFVEQIPTKSHKKLKIAIAIVTSLAIIATTTLLVGYFKFDWFKSEIYNLDAKINRNLYQANYFTETKTINTKIGFTSGITENHEQIIYTNFLVLQTDKKELKNNDFLNTATLVVLDAKMKNKEELKEITSFDIFDQNKINEVKNNPNGAKYPMAVFTFYDNGIVEDILFPNNMDSYNAKTILELIGNVVPQLTRNRVEDISNGIKVTTKKDKNKRTIVESYAPEEYQDFRDSRFVKSVERDIENGQITNIRTKANLDLQTKLKEDEISFGIQEFKYETKSNIVSTVAKEEKENAELIKKVAEYYTFIDGKILLNEIEEKENTVIDKFEIKDDDVSPKLRNLASFSNFNADKTYNIKTINMGGVSVTIKVHIGITGGKAFGEVIVAGNHGNVKFGTNGISGSYSRTWSGSYTFLSVSFPPMPAIHVDLIGSGSITVSASLSGNSLTISISGSVTAAVQITAGWDAVASVSAGARGTIVSASARGTVTTSGGFSKSGSLSAGTVVVYIDGKLLSKTIFHKDWTVFNGWSTGF